MGLALSAALGVAFGAVYIGLGGLTHAIARRVPPRRGIQVELFGVVSRLMLALAAVTLVLAGTSADPAPFVFSFFAVFALGLTADIVRFARARPSAPTATHDPTPTAPPPRTPSAS